MKLFKALLNYTLKIIKTIIGIMKDVEAKTLQFIKVAELVFTNLMKRQEVLKEENEEEDTNGEFQIISKKKKRNKKKKNKKQIQQTSYKTTVDESMTQSVQSDQTSNCKRIVKIGPTIIDTRSLSETKIDVVEVVEGDNLDYGDFKIEFDETMVEGKHSIACHLMSKVNKFMSIVMRSTPPADMRRSDDELVITIADSNYNLVSGLRQNRINNEINCDSKEVCAYYKDKRDRIHDNAQLILVMKNKDLELTTIDEGYNVFYSEYSNMIGFRRQNDENIILKLKKQPVDRRFFLLMINETNNIFLKTNQYIYGEFVVVVFTKIGKTSSIITVIE